MKNKNQSIKHITPDYAHQMIIYEMQLENNEFDNQMLEKLLQIYRKGVEFYSSQQSNYFKYYLNKMNNLLNSSQIVSMLYQSQICFTEGDQQKQIVKNIKKNDFLQKKENKAILNNTNNINNIHIQTDNLVRNSFSTQNKIKIEKINEINMNRQNIKERIEMRKERSKNKQNVNFNQKLNTQPDDYDDYVEHSNIINKKEKLGQILQEKTNQNRKFSNQNSIIEKELENIDTPSKNIQINFLQQKSINIQSDNKFDNNYKEALEQLDKSFSNNKQNSQLYQKLKKRLSSIYETEKNVSSFVN